MSRLVLIDGSSYLYRAFHALPPLTAPDGAPTGALHGIVSMLRATLKEKPDFAAFVMDASGPTFRDDLYAEYKANRPPMPDDLRAQIEPMLQIVEALGFPILRVSGVEADDVIGTLAVQAQAKNIDVTISTSDKDFAQLVRPGIRLSNTMSGSVLDSTEAVIEKFGVRPEQIIDYLALMGDTVDNVPGIDKCGPKTAAKWLGEYSTLENLVVNADKITGKIGENLRAALSRLPLNQQLVTIKLDVALDKTPDELILREKHVDDLKALYQRYGFRSALKELEDGGAATASKTNALPTQTGAFFETPDAILSVKGEYECIVTSEQLASWVKKLESATLFCFDTETDALDSMQAGLVGISLCVESGHAAYIPIAHRYPGAPAQ
ncbi:MAG: 5'-3' exonuclease H3TH domain-containing protein, partial [Arenimonas sp.]